MSFTRNSGDPIRCLFTNSLSGSQLGVVDKYNGLEVRQSHSSKEACEQSIGDNQCGGVSGAKGADREKVI